METEDEAPACLPLFVLVLPLTPPLEDPERRIPLQTGRARAVLVTVPVLNGIAAKESRAIVQVLPSWPCAKRRQPMIP